MIIVEVHQQYRIVKERLEHAQLVYTFFHIKVLFHLYMFVSVHQKLQEQKAFSIADSPSNILIFICININVFHSFLHSFTVTACPYIIIFYT